MVEFVNIEQTDRVPIDGEAGANVTRARRIYMKRHQQHYNLDTETISDTALEKKIWTTIPRL